MRYDLASSGLFGRLAQLVERLVYTENVGGSSPSPPTTHAPAGPARPLGSRRTVSALSVAVAIGLGPLCRRPSRRRRAHVFRAPDHLGAGALRQAALPRAEMRADVISAEGEITNDTADDFSAFLQQHASDPDFRPLVLLNSPGGTVVGAMKLGLLFRQIGASRARGAGRAAIEGSGDLHVVSGYCMSACVYAFFGGKQRIVPPVSQLGIHRMAIYSAQFRPLRRDGESTTRTTARANS